MAKPELPRWATALAADVVEPDPADKDAGWVDGDNAPASWMNWLQREGYKVLAWLDNVEGDARQAELRQLAPSPGTVNPAAPIDPTDSLVTDCPFVFALTTGAGSMIQGTANNKIKFQRGTLIQATADGMMPIELDGTDEVTIANAAGAVPRVDLIQIKIEIDTTTENLDTKKTISVVQGTPNATPTVPTLTAGYVALATVVVGASYAAAAGFSWDDTAGAVAVAHDQRLPLGVTEHLVAGRDLAFTEDANGWAYSTLDRGIVTQGTGATQSHVYAYGPGDTHGRIVGAAVTQLDPQAVGASFNVRFVRRYNNTVSFQQSTMNGATALTGTGGNTLRKNNMLLSQIDGVHVPAAGPTIVASAAGVGAPLWSNGRRAWTDPFVIDNTVLSFAAIQWVSTATTAQQIKAAQLWIAGR